MDVKPCARGIDVDFIDLEVGIPYAEAGQE